MTEQPQYPGPAAPNFPPPVDYGSRTNPTAIVAIVLGFLLPLGGIIAGIVALTQIKRTAERGKGLAITGIAVGSVLTLFAVIGGILLVVLAGLAAEEATTGPVPEISVPDGAEPSTPDDATTEDTDVFTIAVGDCFNDLPASEQVTSVGVLDCGAPHDYEVYSEATVTDAEAFPGDEAVGAEADAACLAAFETFVGIPWDSSALDFSYVVPTAESWDTGDRLVSCLVFDPEVQTTGSLAGSVR